MEASSVFLILFLALALGLGFLTWVSRNVWQSRPRTQLFGLLAILSTVAFVALAMLVVP
jgi:hypothetical protein